MQFPQWFIEKDMLARLFKSLYEMTSANKQFGAMSFGHCAKLPGRCMKTDGSAVGKCSEKYLKIKLLKRKMKRVNFIWAIILLMVTGCGGNKQSADDIIVVDVTKNYPEKELILQDFMDVEYIALESTDEFLCQGVVLDVGKEIILVRNRINDGDIFVFDRKGNGLRKINHRGQGPEEYTSIFEAILDEDNGEIFVREFTKRITVYDLYGKFLRRFPLNEDIPYASIQNYDREHLICGESTFRVDEKSKESQPCVIISKKDGSIVKDFRIHIEQAINTQISENGGNFVLLLAYSLKSIIPYHDSWIITELSSDTIFRLLPDFNLTPFMARTPSVHSMNPKIFIFPVILTDRYYFMETLRTDNFPRIKLIYDRQEKTIYQYTVCNDDYTTPKTIEFASYSYSSINNEIAYFQKIEGYALIEANEKGELNGKLKEVAAKLDEDSNPVIMLVKYKR